MSAGREASKRPGPAPVRRRVWKGPPPDIGPCPFRVRFMSVPWLIRGNSDPASGTRTEAVTKVTCPGVPGIPPRRPATARMLPFAAAAGSPPYPR
ncbi:hypothetical protein GCM10010106_05110 [Thermopolyspora flexuosa]|jgi:hypothetical protein|uniref:Uncharacterized protein n=1 Tax=Thermopolyspora flexuosa TaxID=103836 RepID=A0A543IYZ4_9ACTN|nr:hypothetical protein FHX40_2511 [Thermopolyspora flexuosa]GGM62056.1 hypothetical protein GCM10010106_05110 [Thermopolyspora flexuosa]